MLETSVTVDERFVHAPLLGQVLKVGEKEIQACLPGQDLQGAGFEGQGPLVREQ